MDIEKYKSRYSIVSKKKRLEYASAAAARLSRHNVLEVLEDYLCISRKRQHNPLALSKLQLNLLMDILNEEYILREYRKRLKKLKNKTSSLEESPEKENSAIEIVESEVYFHEVTTKVYREIADGIVWRTLGFNRAILFYMVSQPSPGPISIEGIESELMEWSRTFDRQEGIAILNDITTFLRVGDITILKDDGTLEFVEVKTKRPRGGARFSRQKEKLQQTVEFFSSGEMAFKEETLIIDEFDIKPDNYLNNIHNLIKDAMRDGAAINAIGDHLLVSCIDFRIGSQEQALSILDPILDKTLEKWNEDLVIPLTSLEKSKYGRTYAPYSIFPFPDDICVALMTGALLLTVILNVSNVMKYFEKKGWKILKGPEEHIQEAPSIEEAYSMTVKKGAFNMQVPPMYIAMLGFEFLRPKVIVQLFEKYYTLGPRDESYALQNLKGEKDVWV